MSVPSAGVEQFHRSWHKACKVKKAEAEAAKVAEAEAAEAAGVLGAAGYVLLLPPVVTFCVASSHGGKRTLAHSLSSAPDDLLKIPQQNACLWPVSLYLFVFLSRSGVVYRERLCLRFV